MMKDTAVMIPSLEEIATPLLAPIEPGPADLIPGLMPRKGQLVIAGETNMGKSLLALEIISSLVTGNPLWGELQPTAKVNKVLYVLGEHYREVVQRLATHTKLPFTDSTLIIGPEQLQSDKRLVSRGEPNMLSLSKFKRWAEGVDFIVFDPLSAFISGIDVENDNIQMRLVLDMMSLIAQTSGASCLVLAHKGKPMIDFKTGQERGRQSYGIRGASAIEDAATNIFYLEKGDNTDTSRVAHGQIYELKLRKFKGEAPSEFRLLRNPVNLTHALLGNRPYSEVLRLDARAKLARIKTDNPGFDDRTAIKVLASVEGISEETLRRRVGLQDLEYV